MTNKKEEAPPVSPTLARKNTIKDNKVVPANNNNNNNTTTTTTTSGGKEKDVHAPAAAPKVKTTSVVVVEMGGADGHHPEKTGAKKKTAAPVDVMTNAKLYHAVSSIDRKLFHFHPSAHKVRTNGGGLYKFGYRHLSHFLAYPQSVHHSVHIGNHLVDLCNLVVRKFTFKSSPDRKELVLVHNPLLVAQQHEKKSPADWTEARTIFAALAQVSALTDAYVHSFQQLVDAHLVKDLGEALNALEILKNTVHTFQLSDREVRAKVQASAVECLGSLEAELQNHPTPLLLEARHDLGVFASVLKQGGCASWQFVQTLIALVQSEEPAAAKTQAAASSLMTALTGAYAETLFPSMETIVLALHTLHGTIPTNAVSYFVRHQANFGTAARSLWAIVRDLGSPALLTYIVLKQQGLLGF